MAATDLKMAKAVAINRFECSKDRRAQVENQREGRAKQFADNFPQSHFLRAGAENRSAAPLCLKIRQKSRIARMKLLAMT